jgi:DNA-binding CsgD family transcriptional regulator
MDAKIIDLVVLNKTSKEISHGLKISLSIVQRTVRNLAKQDYVITQTQID